MVTFVALQVPRSLTVLAITLLIFAIPIIITHCHPSRHHSRCHCNDTEILEGRSSLGSFPPLSLLVVFL